MKCMMIIIVFLGVFLLTGGPGFMIVGASSGSLLLSESDPTLKPKKCRYGKEFSMKTVECDRIDLEELPDLHSDIEILYFSHNRLGELTNDTLKKYSDLVFAIFRENFILNIEAGAFANQEGTIKGIDLTKNGLLTFPMNILEYDNFIKLYLGKNQLTDTALNYTIESGLEVFELFNNKLTKLPTTLSLPALQTLNISNNKITKIKPEELAHFCSLRELDINKNPLRMDGCECNALKKWINIRNIKVTPIDIKCDDCPSFNNNSLNNAFEIYNKCIGNKLSRESAIKFSSLWKYVGVIIVVIIIIIIGAYCTYKKRNKKGQNSKINKELVLSTNGATTELLNNGIKNQADEA